MQGIIVDLKRALLKPSFTEPKKSPISLSTGLSLLNLALTGGTRGGVDAGSVVWITGPPDSGRTTLGLTLLAEACCNGDFSSYFMAYVDTEDKDVDITRYFGKRVGRSVKVDKIPNGTTIWEYLSAFAGSKGVCFVDSLDGVVIDGDYAVHESEARGVFKAIRESGSILILTARENKFGPKTKTTGGTAIPFLADYYFRTRKRGALTYEVGGTSRVVGVETSISVVKGRGKVAVNSIIPAPVFTGSGYSNAESMFRYLRRHRKIKALEGGIYSFPFMGLEGSEESIVSNIENDEERVNDYLKTMF